MAPPTNPYIAGAPLRAQSGFYGRKGVLEWVERELRNPNTNALVLFGQRRVGKTTLLLQLQRTLPQDEFLPIYFDLQDQATRSLGTVLADLADTISERVGISPPAMEAFDDGGRFFQTRFLTDLYATLDGRRLVLLLDEFDVLDQVAERELPESAATKALFPFLRRLMLQEPALAFVFVVGRRAEDLTLDFTATFKASLTREVWALDRESAVNLIRQAESAGTLSFSDSAIERVLDLSSGHPYLIQLLCQRMWERAHEKESGKVPLVDLPFVDATVPNSLEAGYQAFAWLWDGLSPAEKIYTAAFAEATEEGETIAEDQVIHILAAHAARLRTREVEMAPQDLVRRRVLVEVGDHVYRFNIELFRRWIRAYKPLREVKDELDQIDPLADQTFEVGRSFYLRHNWEVSTRYFRDALTTNPRHLKALLFLGEALMAVGEMDQAVVELEKAFALDRDEARLPLARALIASAKSHLDDGDEDAALAQLARALQLSPQEHEALQIKADIWIVRGDKALDEDDLESALAAYDKAGNSEKSDQVMALIQERNIASLESEARSYERSAQWAAAAHCYEQLLAQDVNGDRQASWLRALERATDEAELSHLFAGGLSYLEEEKWDQAQRVFADIVHRRPGYAKDGQLAIRLLEKAVNEGNSLSFWRRPVSWVVAFGGAAILLLVLWAVFQAGGRYLPGLSASPATATMSKSSAAISDQSPSGTAVANESSASQPEQVLPATATRTTKSTMTPSPATHTPTAESQASEEAKALVDAYREALEAGKNDEALDYLNQALELDPNLTSAIAERGWHYYHQFGNLDAALADLTRAIEMEPDLVWAYEQRAQVYRSQGNNEAALADWADCLALDPVYHRCYANRADLYLELGDSEAGLDDINEAIDLSPDISGYFALRGDLHFQAWELHEAIADYSKSIALDPGNAYAYQKRGEIYAHHLNEVEKALADFDQAIELNANPWLYIFRARMYAKSDLVEETLADFQSAIDVTGSERERSDIYSQIGRIYLENLDDPAAALIEFNKAIETDPNFEDAYQLRGSTYFYGYAKDYEAALADIDRAIELDPDTAYRYEQRGQVYRASGNQESALADWERCLQLDPEFYWCHLSLGDLYKGLGDTESAVTYFREYLTIVPESECPECQDEAAEYIRNNAPGEVELFATGLNGPFGMDFDQDRNLYVANEGNSDGKQVVFKVTYNGQITNFAPGLSGAAGLAFNNAGILHVSDDTNQIYRVSDSGDLAVLVDSTVDLDNPNAFAFDSNDKMYVVSCGGGNLSVFDPEGALLDFELAGGFNCPQAIVVDDDADLLYITDMDGNIYQIDKMTGESSLIVKTDTRTEGGLVQDKEGILYYSNVSDGQVYRIDPTTTGITICLSGITTPRGLAFDSREILYISTRQSGEIYRAIGCQP